MTHKTWVYFKTNIKDDEMVISYKGKDFYHIFKTESGKMYGKKISRFLSSMHSFCETQDEIVEFSEESIENDKHYCKFQKKEVYTYKILGKVVSMKDSDIKFIV